MDAAHKLLIKLAEMEKWRIIGERDAQPDEEVEERAACQTLIDEIRELIDKVE